MKAQQLKNAILQLAIQGKLVPQDPNDEPASELLCKIQAEKDRLIAEGKIKKNKKTADKAPYTIEPPFEIPESWVWVRLGDICLKITDGTHHSPPNIDKSDFLYITAKNIKKDGLDLSKISYVTKEIHNEIFSRCNPEKGDILYIKDGATTGVSIINTLNEPFSMLSSVALIKTSQEIDNEYLNYVMNSHYFYNISIGSMSGTGIPRITLTKLESYLVPVPPLLEQQRIVQKIEELLPLVERYEQTEQQLTKLNNTFPEQLKKSVLHAAIQGKLT
ncbi:TPA: restriction endonuclease subunit S, partial [Mannheimia haemolytica]|nr:restriction endonuclease subunit S [Mannheimia haemolytica]HDL5928598.1 restriction endonuclease subunit S [Mannheimia haemolytica]